MRILFKKLLCTLSATFINSTPDGIDKEIDHGLELIVRFLGADRGSVSQFSEDEKSLEVTHLRNKVFRHGCRFCLPENFKCIDFFLDYPLQYVKLDRSGVVMESCRRRVQAFPSTETAICKTRAGMREAG